jgi:hypothetical protein
MRRRIDQSNHGVERQTGGLFAPPARQRFCNRVHERHASASVRCDHRISNARQYRCVMLLALPQATLHGVLVEPELDSDPQVSFGKWLDQAADGLGPRGADDRRVFRVGGEVDDWNVKEAADVGSRFDAIDASPKPDVHQDEIRLGFARTSHGVLSRGHDPDDRQPHPPEPLLEFLGDQVLVFGNQHAGSGHDGCRASVAARCDSTVGFRRNSLKVHFLTASPA